MKSKFKYGAYIVAFVAIYFSLLLIAALSSYFFDLGIPLLLYIVFNIFFIFVWMWIILGELRTKAIRVEFGYDHLTVRRYLGWGPEKTYYFTDIAGYQTAILPARGTSYEYLYLISGGKKVVKLSQFYHKNYDELKAYIISLKINNLGFEQFGYGRELKEIFDKL
jgi:hypothetical protein